MSKIRYSNPEVSSFLKHKRRAEYAANPAPELVREAKKRAKKRKVPFRLTPADITIPVYCPVLGMKLEVGQGKFQDSSPSIDAIIPILGYVPGNVQVISHLANRMKNDATPEQLAKFAVWILSVVTPRNNGYNFQSEAVA